MVVVQMDAVDNGEIYGISDINFTIASFAANGHAKHSLPSVGKPTGSSSTILGEVSEGRRGISRGAVLCRAGCDKQNETNFGKRIFKRKTNYE